MKETFDLRKHLDESENIIAKLNYAATKCYKRAKIFDKLHTKRIADFYSKRAIDLKLADLTLSEANLILLSALYTEKFLK